MKLMVLDGNSIVNRAYYGVRTMLKTRDGLYTNAIFGFLNILTKLLDEEKPEAVCVTFDLHAPTFRHKAYDEYKAGRHAMPDELRMQMPVLKEVLSGMNIPYYEKEGYEADDLIGTISRRCEAAGWDCAIVTGDKDSLQLITEHTKVKLVTSSMGSSTTRDMTPEAFFEQYGFEPIHMIDLKALMGDNSDHLIGVPGVGEKTAMALIQKYRTIDAIYTQMPEIDAKPGVIKKLAAGEQSARDTYWLATIVTDVPEFSFAPEENMRTAPKAELYDLFLRLEFTKLIEKFGLQPAQTMQEKAKSKADVIYKTEVITDESQAETALEHWRKAEHVSLLTLPDLTGIAVVSAAENNTLLTTELYFDQYEGDWNRLLKKLFSSDVKKVSHHVKDLMRTLLENNIHGDGFVFDTALAAYLLDATAGSYELEKLFVSFFNEELPKAQYLEPDAFSMLGDSAQAEASFCSYAAVVEALYETLAPQIESENMHELLYEIELPLCAVLAEMEYNGCRVDGAELTRFGEDLSVRIAEKEAKIYELAGEKFNINSPKQLGEILFEKMGIPPVKKTKTGYSTNAEVLEKLRYVYPIVDEILEYRQYAKLKSTYADGLLKEIRQDGRIHTNFQMTVTATGRLSSTEPNLQNIPTRTELGSELRRMFVPQDGYMLVDADYSQIELRLLAHISNDTVMQEAFLSGEDIHATTASHVFNVPLADVTPNMRRSAKAVNFGIVYGISPFSLSKDIGVTVAEAKSYIDNYFGKYQGVKQYMEDVVAKAKEDGCVETLYHRRRALPELKSSNFNLRSFGERVALNMPIQGTAADIMKLAMVRVWKRLKQELPEARLVLQIHDELILECPETQADTAKTILQEEMMGVAALRVPLLAEAHSGKNWLDAK